MDFRLLRNLVLLREIGSMEALSEQMGKPIEDIERAFKKYPKEYEQMKKDMEKNARRKETRSSS